MVIADEGRIRWHEGPDHRNPRLAGSGPDRPRRRGVEGSPESPNHGDTIVIGFDSDRDGADDHVRLVLVDAPELNQTGGPDGKAYLESLCLCVRAVIDEDDFQV